MKEEDVRENVKNRLIELRIAEGLTQSEVGRIVDKSKTTVATWEQGRALPDIQTLYKLSCFYDKSLDYIFGKQEQTYAN